MESAPVKFEQKWLWQKMPSTREKSSNKKSTWKCRW